MIEEDDNLHTENDFDERNGPVCEANIVMY